MTEDMPIMVSPETDLKIRRGECERPMPFPMALLRPHEAQARHNHGQSLDQLRARGGCSACELVAIVEDRAWSRMDEDAAFARLAEHIKLHVVPVTGRPM